MSNRRFIEISSTHRNRVQYPNPSDFEVPFSPSRTLTTTNQFKGAYYNDNVSGKSEKLYTQTLDIADTVTNGIVEFQWFGSNILYDTGVIQNITSPTSPYIIDVVGLTSVYTSPYTKYNIVINNKQIQITNITPIISGYTISFSSTSNLILSQGLQIQITTNNNFISGYNYIDKSTIQPFSSNTTTNTNIYINVSSLLSPYKNVPNYYVGYLLVLQNGIAGIISSYNPSLGLFTLNIPILTTQTISSGDSIYILDVSNCSSIPITITYSGTSYIQPQQTIILPQIDSSGKTILQYEQSYNGYYLIDETQSLNGSVISSKIVSYDFFNNTATLENPIQGWTNNNLYSIRRTLPNFIFTNIQGINTSLTQVPSFPKIVLDSNCIFLPSSVNNIDYTGYYIYIYPNKVVNNKDINNTPLKNIEGSCYYINSYIGNLTIGANNYKICFVSPLIPPELKNGTQFYPSYITENPIIPLPGTVINITSFYKDNYNPLIYNGSVVSQNETVAYEISLINLTLPNIILLSGARISFYPFVYVELSNVTASSSSSKNIIYSNNPNSYRALFIVPITDITDPIRSPFIKLDAGSMVQTVKFKPNDCLKFSVFLPDGQLFQTVNTDYYSPSATNPFVQIDALFGIKRLSGV